MDKDFCALSFKTIEKKQIPNGECYYFKKYIPATRVGVEQDEFSKDVLYFKEGNDMLSQNKFLQILKDNVKKDVLIINVPPRLPKQKNSLSILINNLCKNPNWSDGSGYLIRTKPIFSFKRLRKNEKKKETQIKSIDFKNSEKCTGKNILVIDDVVTSGITIESCKEIILKGSKPKSITLFAFGFTILP